MERKKLDLQLNSPVDVELLFDEPIVGTNRYGEYYLYAVKAGEEEYSLFASPKVHETLRNLNRGNIARLTKTAKQNGSKVYTDYNIEVLSNGNGHYEEPQNGNGHHPEPSNGNSRPAVPENGTGGQKTNNIEDRLYDIMLHCYRDALKIQGELNGMADPERIAITLFIARSKQSGSYAHN